MALTTLDFTGFLLFFDAHAMLILSSASTNSASAGPAGPSPRLRFFRPQPLAQSLALLPT
jgi:hypothetical protein